MQLQLNTSGDNRQQDCCLDWGPAWQNLSSHHTVTRIKIVEFLQMHCKKSCKTDLCYCFCICVVLASSCLNVDPVLNYTNLKT